MIKEDDDDRESQPLQVFFFFEWYRFRCCLGRTFRPARTTLDGPGPRKARVLGRALALALAAAKSYFALVAPVKGKPVRSAHPFPDLVSGTFHARTFL